jgi:hypothetical protein
MRVCWARRHREENSMIFQLSAFSLYLSVLLLLVQFLSPVGPSAPGRPARQGALGDRSDRLGALLRDALRTYVLTASFALLAYLQGKPDLLPQYLVWAVFALTLVKAACLWLGRQEWARWVGVINVAVLVWLWVQELPIFQPHPA